MFLAHRPTSSEIDNFLQQSRDLPLSYNPVGISKEPPRGFSVDTAEAVIGQGQAAFRRAQQALREWRQFDFGWVELLPRGASTECGTVVAVLVHHIGLWSLNGCRVVYSIDDESRYGFAYGTLTNHAEMGEEIFEVSFEPLSENVSYKIRAVSKPRAALARLGYPYVRLCQSRFRKDSIAAMRRAIGSH